MNPKIIAFNVLISTLFIIGCAGTYGQKSEELSITGIIVQLEKGGNYIPPSSELQLVVYTSPRSEEVKPASDGTFRISHGLHPFVLYTITATDPAQPELGGSIRGVQLNQLGDRVDVGYLVLGIPLDLNGAQDLKQRVDTGGGDVRPSLPGH